jgi:hypothetical protein
MKGNAFRVHSQAAESDVNPRNHGKDFQTSIMKLDPAVIEILSLDPSRTNVSSASGGGSSSASTSKITTALEDGTEKHFFMKTGSGKDAEIMFKGRAYPSY